MFDFTNSKTTKQERKRVFEKYFVITDSAWLRVSVHPESGMEKKYKCRAGAIISGDYSIDPEKVIEKPDFEPISIQWVNAQLGDVAFAVDFIKTKTTNECRAYLGKNYEKSFIKLQNFGKIKNKILDNKIQAVIDELAEMM